MLSKIIPLLTLVLSLQGGSALAQTDIESEKLRAAEAMGLAKSIASGQSGNGSKQLEDVQQLLGVQGVSVNQAPTAGTTAGGLVTATFNYGNSAGHVFECKTVRPSRVFSAGPLSYVIDSCDMSAGVASSVSLRICDDSVKAGVCDEGAASFNKSVKLNVNQPFVPFQAALGTPFYAVFDIGVGCNSTNSCFVTVRGTKALGGSGDSLKSEAVTMRNASSAVANLNNEAVQKLTPQVQASVSADLVYCNDKVKQAAANGKLIPCAKDGDPDILRNVDNGGTPAVGNGIKKSCSATAQCAEWAEVTYKSFERTCRRTFPTTQRVSNVTYEKLLTCKVIRDSESSNGTVATCTDSNGQPSSTDGMMKVGSTCPASGCPSKTDSWTEYWVSSSPNVSVKSTLPSRIKEGGICSTPATGAPSQCLGWFGRTESSEACTDSYGNESSPEVLAYLGLNFTQRAGCGICVAAVTTETCQAVDQPTQEEVAAGALGLDTSDCDSVPKNECVFKSSAYEATSGPVVISQLDTYSCAPKRNKCVRWDSADQGCNEAESGDFSVNTLGMGSLVASTGEMSDSFTNALVDAATADGLAANSTSNSTASDFTIFAGDARGCKRPVGGLGSVFRQNCCRSDLNRPEKDGLIQGGCTMSDVRLAAAKRSRYTVYIGDYCSREVNALFFRFCLETTESYCAYPGLLPRIVQEQGYRQLNELTQLQAAQTRTTEIASFKYYNTEGSTRGAWSPPVTVNGTSVSAWQWPAYCKQTSVTEVAMPDGATANVSFSDSESQKIKEQNAQSCPQVVTSWIAACDAGTACMPIPGEPFEGGLGWSIKNVDPLKDISTAINSYVVAKGACNTETGDCSYRLSGWPAGQGGNILVTKTLTFTYKQAPGAEGSALSKALNIGDVSFRGVSSTGPDSVGIQVFPVAVGDSSPIPLTIGAQQYLSEEGKLPYDKKTVTISGGCQELTNTCVFKLTTDVTVTAKSFGSPRAPNCTGFTPNQIAALNFAKMDLSEWIADMMSKVGNTAGALAEQTKQEFQTYNETYAPNTLRGRSDSVNKFARVTPTEGFGPFDVSLSVAGHWPETTGVAEKDVDKVTGVTVDWDDCGVAEVVPVSAIGVGFRTPVKTYKEPSAYNCVGHNGAAKTDALHKIKLTITTTNSGVQTRTITVRNSYTRFSGAQSGNVSATKKSNDIDVLKDPVLSEGLARESVTPAPTLKLGN